jgi:hypothetical protein
MTGKEKPPRIKEVYSGAEVVIAATCAVNVNLGIFRTWPASDLVDLPLGHYNMK